MWNLELHIEKTSNGCTPHQNPEGEMFTFWHVVETKEIYSELDQWQTIAEWVQKHNLNFYKSHYFICLSRISHGVNIYNEKEINGHGFAGIAG
jgi:hypothetical protein